MATSAQYRMDYYVNFECLSPSPCASSVELAEYLEDVLGREVDLLTPEGIRGIRLPWVAEEIGKSVVYVEADRQDAQSTDGA